MLRNSVSAFAFSFILLRMYFKAWSVFPPFLGLPDIARAFMGEGLMERF